MFTVSSFICVPDRAMEPGGHPLCNQFKEFKETCTNPCYGKLVVSDHSTEWADPTQHVLRWPMVLLFLLLLISTKQNMTVLNLVNSKRKNEPLFGEVWLCKNGFLKMLI